MESGGVSKSMSNLLNVVDTKTYDVDLFILNPTGVFMDTIPSEINIIKDKRISLFFLDFPYNIPKLLKYGYFLDAIVRFLGAGIMFFNKGIGAWILSKRIKKLNKKYDLAVDFNGQHQLYYLIDRVKAKKKVTFFHSDYGKWPYYYSTDKRYMPKADFIFTISNKCAESLMKYFPQEKNKIGLFENITSPKLIRNWANEKVLESLDVNFEKLISVGHVSKAKGFDLAMGAASILKNRGVNFKWYFIGEIANRQYVDSLVTYHKLEKNIIFLGVQINPYPFIKQADIFVHLSRFEGKSIALDEAKILLKPIVVTNFSTVNDQFRHRINASICAMDVQDIAFHIEEILADLELRRKYVNALRFSQQDTTMEIEKLYKLIK